MPVEMIPAGGAGQGGGGWRRGGGYVERQQIDVIGEGGMGYRTLLRSTGVEIKQTKVIGCKNRAVNVTVHAGVPVQGTNGRLG